LKRKITYLIFVFALSNLQNIFAQFPYQEVVNSTGNDATAGGIHLSYSVGEPVITTYTVGVGTVRALTQGFLQTLMCPTIAFVSAFPNDTICIGSSTTLGISLASGTASQLTYNWSPSSSLDCASCANPVASPTATTTYTIIISQIACQDDTGFITIAVSDPIASISGQDSICDGNSVTLTDSVTGGFSPFSYVWSDGSATSTISVVPSATTTYWADAMDSFGCEASDTITVTVFPNPTITITGNDSICSGSSTTLTAIGASSYVWAPALSGLSCTFCSNPTASPTTTTTYTVTGITNGCTGTQTVTVTVNPMPSATITPSPVICLGNAVTLNGSGGNTYSWSTGASASSIVVTPVTTGATTYSLVAISAASCTSTVAIQTISVNPLPTATISPSPSTTICSGNSTTLTASGGGTYLWNNLATSATITDNPTAQTTYTVTVTDGNGCTDTATATVNVNTPPSVSISPTNASCNSLCNGTATATITSGGTAPFTYLWSPSNQTNISATGLCALTHTLDITDAAGCLVTTTVTITEPAALSSTASVISNVSCFGGNNGSASVSASGGTGLPGKLLQPQQVFLQEVILSPSPMPTDAPIRKP